MPIFRVKSVKIYTGQKKFTRIYPWDPWQIRGMVPCGHVGSHYCDIFVYYSSYFPMSTMYSHSHGPSNCFFYHMGSLGKFQKKRQFLPRKPALLFSPSTWNTIGLFCKPPPGMGDQKVRKGILRTTIGKSWHCQNWRSTTPPIPEFWHKVGFGDKKSVTCDN